MCPPVRHQRRHALRGGQAAARSNRRAGRERGAGSRRAGRALPSVSRWDGAAGWSSSHLSLVSIRGSLCTGDPLQARAAPASRDLLPAQAPEPCLLSWGSGGVGSHGDLCRTAPSSFIHPRNQGKPETRPHVGKTALEPGGRGGLTPAPSRTGHMTLGRPSPLDLGFLICKVGKYQC